MCRTGEITFIRRIFNQSLPDVPKKLFRKFRKNYGPDGVSNINSVREDRASRVLVLVLNQQSATISFHFTRLAIAPGQR